MILKKAVRLFFSVAIAVVCFSCMNSKPKADKNLTVPKIENFDIKDISKKNHQWYCFTYDGIRKVSLPQQSPQVLLKPWTEAMRISSSLSIGTDGFMTVNKLGLMVCDPESENKAVISYDNGIFDNLTVDNMISVDGYPVFHVYQNSEFNDFLPDSNGSKQKTRHPFLVQFQPESSIFIPLLSTGDLNFSDEVEVSDIIYNDNKWTVSLKSEDKESKDFEYMTFSSHENLMNVSPNKRKDAIKKEIISEGEFKEQFTPKNISESPERLQTLLSRLPQGFNFYLQCSVPNSSRQFSFVQNKEIIDEDIMESQVLLDENYSIAVFTDGTGFFSGSLPGKHILNGGRPIAFRLPKLPKNFKYGSIIVDKNTLYIAWEESMFYEIGRTGYLTVDLEKVFYDD